MGYRGHNKYVRWFSVFVLILLPGCFTPWYETDYIPEGEDATQWIRDHGYKVHHDPDMYHLGRVGCFFGAIRVKLKDLDDWPTAAHEWQHVQDYERFGCIHGRNEPAAYAAEWVYLGCKDEHIPYYLDGRAAPWMLDPGLCSFDLDDVDGSVGSAAPIVQGGKAIAGPSSSRS